MFARYRRSSIVASLNKTAARLQAFTKRFSSNQPAFDGSVSARWQRFKVEVPKAYEGMKRELRDPTFIIFNLSLLIGFIGSCIPNELYLRYCAVLSSTGAIFFNTFIFHGTKFSPNITMIAWDAFRAAAHSSNIVRIWHEQSEVSITEKQEEIYARHFMDFGMRPRQFMKLLNSSLGEAIFLPGEHLVKQGEVLDTKSKLFLLLDGTINAEMNGRVIAHITSESPLCFFGELQLLDVAEDGLVHRKLTQALHAHRLIHQKRHAMLHSPAGLLGFTPEEMEAEEAILFEEEMEESDSDEGEQTMDAVVQSEQLNTTVSDQEKEEFKTTALVSYVVPEGSSARVLVWDGDYVCDILRRDDDFANQVKLVLYAAVRLKLKLMSLKTFERVYEALVTGCLSDGVVNALEKRALEAYRLEHGIDDQLHQQVIEQCGWTVQEYKQGARHGTLERDKVLSSLMSNYDGMLHGIVADGIVNAIERKTLEMHRADHKISDRHHAQALARLGWTLEDFERGFKHAPVVPENNTSDVQKT